VVPPVNASYLHERLRPRFVTGLSGGSSMSAPFGELAADADVTRILHGQPAALDPLRSFGPAYEIETLQRSDRPPRHCGGAGSAVVSILSRIHRVVNPLKTC
jgi:hypothetical protein